MFSLISWILSYWGYFMLLQHICHYLEVYMFIIIYETSWQQSDRTYVHFIPENNYFLIVNELQIT